MILLCILGLAVILFVDYLIAKEFQRIAAMKGHDEKRYFWWTFLTGPLGILMVFALPNWGRPPREEIHPREELPRL